MEPEGGRRRRKGSRAFMLTSSSSSSKLFPPPPSRLTPEYTPLLIDCLQMSSPSSSSGCQPSESESCALESNKPTPSPTIQPLASSNSSVV